MCVYMCTCIDGMTQRIRRSDTPFKGKKLNHTGKNSPVLLNISVQACIRTPKSVQVEKTLISPFTPPISLPMLTTEFHKEFSVDKK